MKLLVFTLTLVFVFYDMVPSELSFSSDDVYNTRQMKNLTWKVVVYSSQYVMESFGKSVNYLVTSLIKEN